MLKESIKIQEEAEKNKKIALSPKQIVFFNFPNLGIQTILALNTYLTITFYINVMGQPPISIGILQSLVILFSALFCPIFGAFSDKISTRFGRKKSLMLISLPFLAVSFVLMWTPPIPETPFGVFNYPIILWYLITSLIFYISAAAYSTSYSSLIPDISMDEQNRVKISESAMIFMVLGVGVGSLIPLFLFGNAAMSLSEGNPDFFIGDNMIGLQIYQQVIFFSLLASVFLVIFSFIMMWKIKEPKVFISNKPSIKAIYKNLIIPLKDSDYKYYIISLSLMLISILQFQMVIINFITFVIDLSAGGFVFLVIGSLIAAMVSFSIFDFLSKKMGLKKVMMISIILATAAFVSSFILLIPMPYDLQQMIGILILSFLIAAFISTMIFPVAIASSLIDAAKERTNENLSGSYIGVFTMSGSLTGTAAFIIIGVFLQIFGTTSKNSYVFILLFGAILMVLSALVFRKVSLKE